LLYDDGCDPALLARAARQLRQEKGCVTVLKKLPDGLKYRELLCMKNGEVSVLEANA
jgi:hypothetical protein